MHNRTLRFGRGIRVLLALGVTLVMSGCIADQRFVHNEAGEGPWLIPIDRDTPVFFESEDANLYLVEERILFPFREPTEEELAEMGTVGDIQVPYPSLPFVRRGDIEVQVDFTLSYLEVGDDAGPVAVTVRLNGINEFHEYNPQVSIVDDDLVVDFSQWERNYRLQPGERVSGTIRQQEMDEVAVDLATVVNGVPNANQIVYFENQSAFDRRSQMFLPDMVPALTGVRIGVLSQGEDDEGALPLLLETTVRITDRRKVMVQGEDEPWAAPAPALFGPADAAPPEEGM